MSKTRQIAQEGRSGSRKGQHSGQGSPASQRRYARGVQGHSVAPVSPMHRSGKAKTEELVNSGVVSEHLTPQTVAWVKRSRYNPIRQLTPDYLARIIDVFNNGYLRDFSLMADAIKRRDDIISVALRKREKAVSRHGFEVLLVDGLDPGAKKRAEQHQAAIKWFFEHCTAMHVLEQDQRGGFRLLVQQMMEAVGYRYAIHEIVWQPSVDPQTNQPRLTAAFNFVPLWFFEATTGKLRFIQHYFGTILGEDMADGEWLVTISEGIMEALAVAYMLKILSLKDWVAFSEKFGMPGVLGKTTAAKDSPAWQAMVEAVESFGQEWSAVCNTEGTIDLIKADGGSGSIPMPALVERMDRAIAAICRGSDLSTMSSGSHGGGGQGRGASVQGDESSLLEEDDAEMISETLQQISRVVIKQLFGEDQPLAYLQIIVPEKKDNADTINKLTFLMNGGVQVGQAFARKELGVPPPMEKEAMMQATAAAAPAMLPESPAVLSNAAPAAAGARGRAILFRAHALQRLTQAQAEALRPLTTRLAEIEGMDNETQQDAAIAKLQADLPKLYARVLQDPSLAAVFEEILDAAFIDGAATAAQKQKLSA